MVLINSLLKGILVKKGSDRVSIPKNDQLSAFAPVEIDLRALRPFHLLLSNDIYLRQHPLNL